MTELQTLASDISGLLDDKVHYRDLTNYSLTSAINNSLSTKANQRNVGNDLALKANLSDVNNLSENVKTQLQGKANVSDLADYYINR